MNEIRAAIEAVVKVHMSINYRTMNAKPRLIKETCIAGAVLDRTVKLTYGCVSGRSRKHRENPTPKEVQDNNDRIAIRKLARVINANFGPGDYHVVLTDAKGMSEEEAIKERQLFLRRMRREYRKAGSEMKAVWTTEMDPRSHHHLVMSSIDINRIVSQWPHGRVNVMPLDDARDYTKLAEYFIKQTNAAFRDPSRATRQRYGRTRNLEDPVIVKQEARVSDLNRNHIKPVKGYHLDPDSIEEYVNPITGIPTLTYRMIADDAVSKNGSYRRRMRGKKIREESFARFQALRQTEFSDLFEWGYL